MLKKIVFLIADEGQHTSIERLKKNMGLDNKKIFYRNLSDWEEEDMEECAKEEILFVTDSSILLRELKQRGDYAIALLHENNRSEDLSGTVYAITNMEELEWESFEKAYLRMAGLPWKIMETKRCIIRETTVADVEKFYKIYAEPSITYYMEDLFPNPADETEYTKKYIQEIYGFYGYGLWSILCKENGEVIGRAGLSWRQGFDMPELGFVIAVPYQRKGYAFEVCLAIVTYGEQELGFRKIQALVKKENRASIHLCRKLGFEWKGRVEDRGAWYEWYVRETLETGKKECGNGGNNEEK